MELLNIATSAEEEEGSRIKHSIWDDNDNDNTKPDEIRWFLLKLYSSTELDTVIDQYLEEIKSQGFNTLNDLYDAPDIILEKLNLPLCAKSKLMKKIRSKRITSYMKLRYAIFMFICIMAVAVDITLLAFNTLIVDKLGGIGAVVGDKRRHNGVDHGSTNSTTPSAEVDSPTALLTLINYIILFHMIEFTVPFLYDVTMQFLFNRPLKYKVTLLIRQFSLIFASLTSGIAALLVYIDLETYESEAHYLEYSSFLFILILDLVALYRNNRDFLSYYYLYGHRKFILRFWKALATLIVTLVSMAGVITVIVLRYYNYEWITHYVEFSINIIVVLSTYLSNDIRQIK